MIAGYETEQGSWGYVLQRACVLGINMLPQIGRTVVEEKEIPLTDSQEDSDDVPKFIRQLRVPGRIVLNVWRLLRHEVLAYSCTVDISIICVPLNLTVHLAP